MENPDYNAFTFNLDNRDISEKNVTDIMNSILEIGYMKSRAIVVNKDFLIIDGHHRFLALKRLCMPIHYAIEENASLREMLLLNSCQKTWKLEDYIILSAKKGKRSYMNIVAVKEKYGFTYSNAIIICTNQTGKGSDAKDVRNGSDLDINRNQKNLIDLLLFSKSQLSFAYKNSFIIALKSILLKVDEDQIEKLKNSLSSIREQTCVINYLVTFENIINRKVRAGNKINLVGR